MDNSVEMMGKIVMVFEEYYTTDENPKGRKITRMKISPGLVG